MSDYLTLVAILSRAYFQYEIYQDLKSQRHGDSVVETGWLFRGVRGSEILR